MKLIELSKAKKVALLNQLLASRPHLSKAAFARALSASANSVTNWTKGRNFPVGEAQLALWRYWGFTGSEEVTERGEYLSVGSVTAAATEQEAALQQAVHDFVRDMLAVIERYAPLLHLPFSGAGKELEPHGEYQPKRRRTDFAPPAH